MKKTFILILSFLFLWACHWEAHAQAPPPWYPPEPPSFNATQEYMPELPASPSAPISPNGEQGSGELTGKVVPRDSNGNPDESKGISGAIIKLYQGNSIITCISGHDGSFALNNVKPGENLIRVSAHGFKQATGKVKVVENDTRSVLVGLSPLWTMKSKDYGYINVYAYRYENYEGKWIDVQSIRVHQVGDFRHRWYNSWNPGYGSTYQSLYCSNAPMEKYYRIEVVWSDGSVRTMDIYLSSKYRDVSIYHW